MAHYFVDTRTDTLGKAFIIEAGRYGTVGCTVVVADMIYLQRVHTRTDMFGHFIEYAGIHDAASAYSLYLLGCFD